MALHLMVEVEHGTAVYERTAHEGILIVTNNGGDIETEMKNKKLAAAIDELCRMEIKQHRKVIRALANKFLEELGGDPMIVFFQVSQFNQLPSSWKLHDKKLVVLPATYSIPLSWHSNAVLSDGSAIISALLALMERRIMELEARYYRMYQEVMMKEYGRN